MSWLGDQWGSAKAKAKNAWGSNNNPLTQGQRAEAYDPNRENFSMYGDPNAAQAQAEALQGKAGGQGYKAAGLSGVASDTRDRALAAGNRGAVGLDASQSGRNAATSAARGLTAFSNTTGQGPSAAQAQLNNATAANMRGNLALARSGRGPGSAQAGRAALGQNTIVQGEAANNAAQLKAQEYAAAEGRRLGALQSNADVSSRLYSQDQTGARNQADVALASRGQNDAYSLGLGNQALGYEGASDAATGRAQGYDALAQGYGQMDLAGRMGYENLSGQQVLGASQSNAQIEGQRDSGLLGMAGGAAMGLVGLSDVRAKKDISPADVTNMMAPGRSALATARSAPAYTYEYRDPANGEGPKVGPMAQDLERTPLGNTLVKETPQGKAVDGGRAGLVALSAAGEQQNQLDALQAEVERLRKNPYSTERWRALEAQ
jgi:hypothetical protein